MHSCVLLVFITTMVSGDTIYHIFICIVINKYGSDKGQHHYLLQSMCIQFVYITLEHMSPPPSFPHSGQRPIQIAHGIWFMVVWHVTLSQFIRNAKFIYVANNEENITLCHLLSFIICDCVCLRVYLSLSVSGNLCMRSRAHVCVHGVEVVMIYSTLSYQINITICHITFCYVDFNHFYAHDKKSTSTATPPPPPSPSPPPPPSPPPMTVTVLTSTATARIRQRSTQNIMCSFTKPF